MKLKECQNDQKNCNDQREKSAAFSALKKYAEVADHKRIDQENEHPRGIPNRVHDEGRSGNENIHRLHVGPAKTIKDIVGNKEYDENNQ
jgi:hypothetical protein